MTTKRLPSLGAIPNLAKTFQPHESLEIFKTMCLIRYFDLKVAEIYQNKQIYAPIYLSIGQEGAFAGLALALKDYALFTQHRCHGVYLAFGGDHQKFIDELLGRPSGCSFGLGGSNRLQDQNIGMFGHHGLIGENAPLAVGYSLGSGKPSISVLGDAAVEEDYVFSSFGFAATHKLPVLFVCDDNDLSILTETSVRRNWEITDVAKGFKMPAIDIADDPWLVAQHARELSEKLPAVLNIRTTRHYWHTGVGIDGPPEWDRLQLVKDELAAQGIEYQSIEEDMKEYVEALWQKQLLKP